MKPITMNQGWDMARHFFARMAEDEGFMKQWKGFGDRKGITNQVHKLGGFYPILKRTFSLSPATFAMHHYFVYFGYMNFLSLSVNRFATGSNAR